MIMTGSVLVSTLASKHFAHAKVLLDHCKSRMFAVCVALVFRQIVIVFRQINVSQKLSEA